MTTPGASEPPRALALEDLFSLYGKLPRVAGADLADGLALARAIDRRRLDEVHACAFCDGRARAAVVLGASDLAGPAQWLDLCLACHRELRAVLDELERCAFDVQELDAEIIRRYEEWSDASARSSSGTPPPEPG